MKILKSKTHIEETTISPFTTIVIVFIAFVYLSINAFMAHMVIMLTLPDYLILAMQLDPYSYYIASFPQYLVIIPLLLIMLSVTLLRLTTHFVYQRTANYDY